MSGHYNLFFVGGDAKSLKSRCTFHTCIFLVCLLVLHHVTHRILVPRTGVGTHTPGGGSTES